MAVGLAKWAPAGYYVGERQSFADILPDPRIAVPPRPSLTVRWILRLYPRGYRVRYGEDIAAFIAEERARGAGGIRFWVGLASDHWRASGRVRRAARGEGTMGRWIQDVRWGLRGLLRAPAFTLFATLTLALGVGATAAVFTVLDRVVLRPFPWDGGERIHQVGAYIMGGDEIRVLSAPVLRALVDDPGDAEAVVGAQPGSRILAGAGDPERVEVTSVSEGYFPFFAVRPALGRLLGPADHAASATPVAVLSHGLWTRRFGADPGVVGRTIRLDDEPYEVVGVLAAGVTAPSPEFFAEGGLLVPLGLRQGELDPGSFGIRSAARLREGAPPAAFRAHLERVGGEIYPDDEGFVTGFGIRPLREMIVGPELDRGLWRLLAAVALLLVIGCVNVASLFLTRGSSRAAELSVRTALGASRSRLVRQLLAEGVLLAGVGGVVAGGLAFGAVELFRRTAPDGLPRLAEVAVDPRIFALTLALSLVTVLGFAVLPALRASRGGAELRGTLGRTGPDRRERALRGGLVLVETALAVVLVAWSGLLSADLVRMTRDEAGFRRDGLVSARVSLRGRPADASPGERHAFFDAVRASAEALPGVTRAGLATELPYSGSSLISVMMPEGTEDREQGEWIGVVALMGEFLEALGARVVEGRLLDPDGVDADRQVALVNEAFVRTYWPDGRAVGRTIKSGGPDVDDEGSFEVVGVLADVRAAPGEAPPPKMYVPYGLERWNRMVLLLETEGDPASLVPGLRERIAGLDPGLPLGEVLTLDEVASEALARPRFYRLLFASFALVALLLATVGVYGTTAFATQARAREFGIRMALGEDRRGVVAGAVRRAGAVVLAGAVAGTGVALLAADILSDTLRMVDARSPGLYLLMGCTVVGVGLLAAWIPARRLSRIDPARTLREEG